MGNSKQKIFYCDIDKEKPFHMGKTMTNSRSKTNSTTKVKEPPLWKEHNMLQYTQTILRTISSGQTNESHQDATRMNFSLEHR